MASKLIEAKMILLRILLNQPIYKSYSGVTKMKLTSFWKTVSTLVMAFVFTITLIATPAFAVETSIGGTRTYNVTVQTGCEGGSGTNANIAINLLSEDDSTGFQTLDTPGSNDFENCDKKIYTLPNLNDIGMPTAVTLRSDNKGGISSPWKVDDVFIEEGSSEEEICPFSAWFDEDHKEITKTCELHV